MWQWSYPRCPINFRDGRTWTDGFKCRTLLTLVTLVTLLTLLAVSFREITNEEAIDKKSAAALVANSKELPSSRISLVSMVIWKHFWLRIPLNSREGTPQFGRVMFLMSFSFSVEMKVCRPSTVAHSAHSAHSLIEHPRSRFRLKKRKK